MYAIVNGNEAGWRSVQTIGLLATAGALLVIFLGIEARVRAPLMPLGLFRQRNVATANVVGVLWAAAMFAWFFISALYLQLVLGYEPAAGRPRLPAVQPDHGRLLARPFRQDGHAFRHQGAAQPRDCCCAAAGLALFALAPVDGSFVAHVLPGMTLLGLGAGMAFNPCCCSPP